MANIIHQIGAALRSFWARLIGLFATEKQPSSPPPTPQNNNPTPPKPTPPKRGYDPLFLGVELPLPKVSARTSAPLEYLHFSILMNKSRKMPYYTAVNIDAVKYNKLKSKIPSRSEIGADNWIPDPRIDKSDQIPKSFYSNNDFDLGHMVRREDALWGDTLEEAIQANNDTFFLTNATPQHKDFNRNAERWKGLEDYALRNARKYDLRLTVFTGCIFKANDREHNNIQIPGRFWKVIVMQKEDGNLSATGYIVQQDDLIKSLTTRDLFVFEQFKTYQVSLKEIEAATKLSFGLNAYDPLQKKAKRGLTIDEPALVDKFSDIEF
jgi:endonuclease G